MTRQEKIMTIADHYGYDRQCKQLFEKMSELQIEICKIWRKNGDRNLGVIDYRTLPEEVTNAIVLGLSNEIADVKIMIEQIEYLLDIGKAVDVSMGRKLDRQIMRIKEENNGK